MKLCFKLDSLHALTTDTSAMLHSQGAGGSSPAQGALPRDPGVKVYKAPCILKETHHPEGLPSTGDRHARGHC